MDLDFSNCFRSPVMLSLFSRTRRTSEVGSGYIVKHLSCPSHIQFYLYGSAPFNLRINYYYVSKR